MTDFVSKCTGFRAAEDLLAVSREIMVAPGTHSYEVVPMASESVENALHLLWMCERRWPPGKLPYAVGRAIADRDQLQSGTGRRDTATQDECCRLSAPTVIAAQRR